MLGIYRVRGESMHPNLSEGDFVVALRALRPLKVGQRVVIDHPRYGILVKRVCRVGEDGRFQCAGDNPASVGPDALGWLDRTQLRGVVRLAVRRPAGGTRRTV